MEFNNLTIFQQHCISNGIPFVSYRQPGSEIPVTMLGPILPVNLLGSVSTVTNQMQLVKQPDLPTQAGFLLSPFTSSSPSLWLQASRIIEGTGLKGIDFSDEELKVIGFSDDELKGNDSSNDSRGSGISDDNDAAQLPIEVTREAYLKQVSKILGAIKLGPIKKAVLSRALLIPFHTEHEAPQLFSQLTETYKDAFVYLLSFPGSGIWTGATPELLMSAWDDKNPSNTRATDGAEHNEIMPDGDANHSTFVFKPMHIRTMALAGTRKSGTTGEWGNKEIEEQQWVATYIQEKLVVSGCNGIMQSETYTAAAGNIEHLRTDFRASMPAKNMNVLLQQLHPTPAVCGWPADEALKLILETEGYNRSYYTGFLGPVNVDGASSLYVNLRCMQATDAQAALYVGGGITHDSIPEDEWEETSIKSRTLLSEIEKIRNLAH